MLRLMTTPRRHGTHHFDIARNGHGLWRVTARDGLVGGTFRSEKAAIRFAMDEADGDDSCVHTQTPGGHDRH